MSENKRRNQSQVATEFEVTLVRVPLPDRTDRLRRAIDLILAAVQRQDTSAPTKTHDADARNRCL